MERVLKNLRSQQKSQGMICKKQRFIMGLPMEGQMKTALREISVKNSHAKWIGAGKLRFAEDSATIQT